MDILPFGCDSSRFVSVLKGGLNDKETYSIDAHIFVPFVDFGFSRRGDMDVPITNGGKSCCKRLENRPAIRHNVCV